MDSLAEAREFVEDGIRDKGVTCPCCGQFAKLYPRTLNGQMASALIKCWRAAGTDWFHVPTLVPARADEAKLRYWGFIEQDPTRNGYWRVTEQGVQFIRQLIRVPRQALVYNTRLYGFKGPDWGIKEALGQKFDYDELMGPAEG